MKYSDKLKDPRWQKKRLQIFERDNFKCFLCGNSKITLNAHHVIYIDGYDPWDYKDELLVTLCEKCHAEIHLDYKNELCLLFRTIYYLKQEIEHMKDIEEMFRYSDVIAIMKTNKFKSINYTVADHLESGDVKREYDGKKETVTFTLEETF